MKNVIVSIGFMFILIGCSSMQTQSNSKLDASASINVRLGLAYLQQEQLPQAKQKLLLALQQDPNSPIVLDAVAYFWEVTGRQKAAILYYRKAVMKHPRSGLALNNYGVYLCRQRQYRQAEQYLLAAANEADYLDSALAFENAGLCALENHQQNKAISYFISALNANPNLSTSYFELARLYYSRHQYDLAKKYLNGYHLVAGNFANSLWLAIQIANKTEDVATLLKDGALLEKNFPNSTQYQLYQKMQLS